MPARYLATYNESQLEYDLKKVKFFAVQSKADLELHAQNNAAEAKALRSDTKSDLIFKIVFGQYF